MQTDKRGRAERLQQARQVFAGNAKETGNPGKKDSERQSKATYMQFFCARFILTLFVVVCLGFYAIAAPKKFQTGKEWLEKQISSNAFVQDAYATYTEVDYRQMIEELASLVKQ